MRDIENHLLSTPEPPEDIPDAECCICGEPLWYDPLTPGEALHEVDGKEYCTWHKPQGDEDE